MPAILNNAIIMCVVPATLGTAKNSPFNHKGFHVFLLGYVNTSLTMCPVQFPSEV